MRRFRGELIEARRFLRPTEIRVAARDFEGVTFGLFGPALEPDLPPRPEDRGRPADEPVPEEPEEPALVPRDDEEGPGNGIIGYRDRRMLETSFREYTFDHLDFLGIWNSSRVVPGENELFVRHWGMHFNERCITISLPATLVDELKDWWSNRVRDNNWENYSLATARSRILTSELAITASQQYIANLYGPAVAFIESYDVQQNVARVVRGAHFDMRRRTIAKNRETFLQTRFGKLVVGAAVVCAVGAAIGGYLAVGLIKARAARASRPTTLGVLQGALNPPWSRSNQSLPQVRLVGIELNPGPALIIFYLGVAVGVIASFACVACLVCLSLFRRPPGW
jgi:hypothetical protein